MKNFKRMVAIVVTLAMTAALLGACGSKSKSTGEKKGESSRDSLVIGMAAEISTLDPHMHSNIGTANLMLAIFESLLTHDFVTDEIKPGLAESYEVSEDGMTIDMTLRTDFKFHNGDPVTMEDVLYSMERTMGSAFQNVFWDAVDNVEAVDDTHLRFNLNQPDNNLPYYIADFANIVPKAVVEADPDGFARAPIGCGPYKFVNWSQGMQIDMEADPNYPDGEAPIKNVTWRFITDRSTALVALETGEVDAFMTMNGADFDQIRNTEGLTLKTVSGNNTYYLSLNMEDEVLSNDKVREAICLAIDKQSVIDGAEYGEAKIADHGFIREGQVGYSDNYKEAERDVERAKALLAEAGYANGLSLELKCQSSKTTHAQVIQANLKEIGIDAEIVQLENSAFYADLENGEFQMEFGGFGQYTPDPSSTFRYVYRSDGVMAGNYYRLNSPEIDELLARGEVSTDPEERQKIYEEVIQLVEDAHCCKYIYWPTANIAHNSDLKGVEATPVGEYDIYNYYW